jgi:hypothetical protein
VLVEEGVLTKAKAIEAIETVAELTHEISESAPSVTSQIAVDLVEDLAASFTLQDSAPSNANLEAVASARSPRRQLGIAVSGLGRSVKSESLGRSTAARGRRKTG